MRPVRKMLLLALINIGAPGLFVILDDGDGGATPLAGMPPAAGLAVAPCPGAGAR